MLSRTNLSKSNDDSADGATWAVITLLILLLVLGLLYFGGAFASRAIDKSINKPGLVVVEVK